MSAYDRLYERMPRRINYSAKTDRIGLVCWVLVVSLVCISVIVFATPRTGWGIAFLVNAIAFVAGLFEFNASIKEDEIRQYGDLEH